ncbi:MAG: hypothetical protein Q4C58_04015 [Eubacteriales bacterium]|nr:hypothetical protein [Eubacteriales bacterium]
MDFFEKMGETISTRGKEAAQKAKDVADLARLNAQAGQLEGKIKTYYQIIGEKVYQSEKDQDHSGLEAEFDLINDAFAEIGKIRKQISEIKGTKACAECKAEVDIAFPFCPHCGTKFEEESEAESCEAGPEEETCGEEAGEACTEEVCETCEEEACD